MKIRIMTSEYEYQGLYYDSVVEDVNSTPNGAEFLHRGKWWVLGPTDYIELVEEPIKQDAVNHPKHYAVFEQLEAIEVIASSMTLEQFYGYCLGNILKYRLRVGGKDDVMQELGKVSKYQELFTNHKYKCRDFK